MSTSYKFVSNIVLSRLISYSDKIIGTTNVNFDIIRQQMIRFSISVRHWRKIRSLMVQHISFLYISRKSMIHLGGKYCTIFSVSSEYPGN
jgi:hypothetical protein